MGKQVFQVGDLVRWRDNEPWRNAPLRVTEVFTSTVDIRYSVELTVDYYYGQFVTRRGEQWHDLDNSFIELIERRVKRAHVPKWF